MQVRHRSKSSLWFGGAESAGDVIDPLRPRALRHLTQTAGKMSGEKPNNVNLEVELEILPCCDVGHKEAVIISRLYHHCHLHHKWSAHWS